MRISARTLQEGAGKWLKPFSIKSIRIRPCTRPTCFRAWRICPMTKCSPRPTSQIKCLTFCRKNFSRTRTPLFGPCVQDGRVFARDSQTADCRFAGRFSEFAGAPGPHIPQATLRHCDYRTYQPVIPPQSLLQ